MAARVIDDPLPPERDEDPEERLARSTRLLENMLGNTGWDGSEPVPEGEAGERRVLLGRYYHPGRTGTVFLQPQRVTFYLNDLGEVVAERLPTAGWPFMITIKRVLNLQAFISYRDGGLVYDEIALKNLCLASRILFEDDKVQKGRRGEYIAPYYSAPTLAEQLFVLCLIMGLLGVAAIVLLILL